MTVTNGKAEGVVRELWPSGKLKRATLFKAGEGSDRSWGWWRTGRSSS